MCRERADSAAIRERLSESHKGLTHTEATKERIRQSMREAIRRSPDAYAAENVCGRVERIPIVSSFGEETTVHGTWEWEVALFFRDNGIRWTNDVRGFAYRWEGDDHLYFPDVYLPERDTYVEVKGYERPRDRAKWRAFPKTLVLIRRPEIQKIREGAYTLGP